jgi:hypothetical protein
MENPSLKITLSTGNPQILILLDLLSSSNYEWILAGQNVEDKYNLSIR